MRHPLDWLLRIAVPRDDRPAVLGDLAEEYERRVRPQRSWLGAQAWYLGQLCAAVGFALIGRGRQVSRAVATLRLEAIRQDVRYAARGLVARPTFTVGVALTLALGIGANAAVFSLVDRLLFRPPAYLKDASRVNRVYFAQTFARTEHVQQHTSIGRYLDLKKGATTLSTVAAFATQRRAIGDGTAMRELLVTGASAAYFDLFDARPVLGRFYTEDDDRLPRGAPVAVLGYTLWQTDFAGQPDVLGRQLRIGGTSYTVIGVAPKGFTGLTTDVVPAVYVPFAAFVWDARPGDHTSDYHWQFLELVARRATGVTAEIATADLSAAVEQSFVAAGVGAADRAAARPRAILGPVQVERGPDAKPEARVALWAVGVAAMVFLIACANVANLLLARAIARRREVALRLALGVSVGRLLRQLLIETTLLALLGAAGALVVAQGVEGLMHARFLLPDAGVPVLADARTIGIVCLTSMAAMVIIGIAPAWQARQSDLVRALGAGARGTGRTSRLRMLLLATQVTLSVVLLIGAGLFVRSLQAARGLHLGYDADAIVVVSDHVRGSQRSPGTRFVTLEHALSDAAMTLPGVVAATPAPTVPFFGFEGRPLSVDGIGVDDVDLLGNFILQVGTPDYFRTMGTRLVRGRGFESADRADAPPVVIVSQGMGVALWSGRDPIGQCLYIHVGKDSPPCSRVVGVAEDTRLQSLDLPREYAYYVPLAQYPDPTGTILVRVGGHAEDFADAVRRQLQPLMPIDAYLTAVPLEDMLATPTRSWQLGATMFVAFGGLALIVAAIGLYSVIAYGVAQQTREIAIRVALGARRATVVGLVLQRGLTFVLASAGAGMFVVAMTTRWTADLLFHVSPTDPLVFAGVVGVLLVVALAALYVPARAATQVDPISVLRAD
jgi:putative ABC transport system permease protein